MIRSIRNSARALIVHDGKLLAIKMRDAHGLWYILPGGGQHPGETLRQSLERECLEEINCRVSVGTLLYIREYIGRNHQFATAHRNFHQVEMVFLCELAEPTMPCVGNTPDKKQIGIAWIDLEHIEHVRFYPAVVKPLLAQLRDGPWPEAPVYLGDCN